MASNASSSSATTETQEGLRLWENGQASGSGSRSSGGGFGIGIVVTGSEDPQVPRQQAGPLPSKRGEIGFREDLQGPAQTSLGQSRSTLSTSLPARHPADRDPSPTTPGSPPNPNNSTNAQSSDNSSTHTAGKRSLISLSNLPKVGGVRLATIITLIIQTFILAGTIAGWAIVAKRLPAAMGGPLGINTTSVFIHVTFTIAVLLQVVFLERTIFRVRAERYVFKYPGGIIPTTRNRGPVGLGLAPWNRPPLPTYAAALQQSGYGTGDVEDHVIAVPPPPAYGNTRGSTLLLSGFMRNSLRAQRVRERVREEQGTPRGSWLSTLSRGSEPDRPLSYRSHDSDWEERLDASRALRLEETLARLEEGGVRTPEPTRATSSRQ